MDKPFKILMLDDEPDIQEFLAEIISDAGYEVICLPSGEGVLEAIAEHLDELCLIISDYNMPGMTGLEVRSCIQPDYNGIPFVILSSEVSREMLETALELNISAFLEKPIDPEALVEAVEKYSKERQNLIEEKAFLKKIFIEESEELIAELEPLILDLEQNPDEIDSVNSIFRLVHTIKGGSGVLEQPQITAFVHSYEDLLGKIKNATLRITPDVVSVLLAGFDELSQIVASMGSASSYPIDLPYWQSQFALSNGATAAPAGNSCPKAAKTNKPTDKGAGEKENIKVPTHILNEFMELSGEITVIKNSVNKLVQSIKKELQGSSDLRLLAEMIEEMNKINSSMQTKITDIRKLPVQSIFRTFARVTRDIATGSGKEIVLEISGESLRVDTTLHQVLSNSLIHIVRNACDHGLEAVEDRTQTQKSPHGTIRLDAAEVGEFIQITIQDDGRGIDPEKIKASALKKNLYTEPELAAMSDGEVFQIIFEPGFSTAAQITDVSGRGVGMDMVRTSVESIGGKIIIESTLGEGTTFTFRLPIPRSVLIIKSLSVENAGKPYFLAQDGISRIIKIDESNYDRLIREVSGSQVIQASDQLLPLVALGGILDASQKRMKSRDFHVLIVQGDDFRYGIAVDRIIDSEEIVVKALAPYLKKIGMYLGATFLSDGGVGIVLDVGGIAKNIGIEKTTQDLQTEGLSATHTDTQGADQPDHLLVVSLFCEGFFAFDLAAVFRLEQIAVENLRNIAGHTTFIYRGKATEVVDLTKQLSLGQEHELHSGLLLQTVVVKREDRYIAFVIDSIREIIEKDPANYQPEPEQGFIAGNQIQGENLICVFDTTAILRSVEPKSSLDDEPVADAKEESGSAEVTSIAPAASQDIAPEPTEEEPALDMAAGWGEF